MPANYILKSMRFTMFCKVPKMLQRWLLNSAETCLICGQTCLLKYDHALQVFLRRFAIFSSRGILAWFCVYGPWLTAQLLFCINSTFKSKVANQTSFIAGIRKSFYNNSHHRMRQGNRAKQHFVYFDLRASVVAYSVIIISIFSKPFHS